MIIDPKGEILETADDLHDQIVHARVFSSEQSNYREKFPVLKEIISSKTV